MGEPLARLLETEIWSRLAAQHDAAIVVDRSGFPYVGAGMNASIRDLANFGLMMIHDGVLNGRQIVPSAWIADTLKGDGSSKACFAKGAYGAVMPGWHYRNQVWVASSEPALMLAIGIYGQFVYMDKARDLVIVMLSSQQMAMDVIRYLDTLAAMRAIGAWLETEPVE
jgi:CubicO group peptidase (beta-lactamase class C family)